MEATEIKLYDIFRNDLKLSDERAKIFAEVVKETVINEVNHSQTEFKSQNKEDLLKIDFKIEQTKSELKQDIYGVKNDILKWIFAFWVTIVIMFLTTFFIKR